MTTFKVVNKPEEGERLDKRAELRRLLIQLAHDEPSKAIEVPWELFPSGPSMRVEGYRLRSRSDADKRVYQMWLVREEMVTTDKQVEKIKEIYRKEAQE